MAKYKHNEGKYLQIYWEAINIINKAIPKIPNSAKWLYAHLCYLEHKYSGKKEDFFFRSIDDLQKDTSMGRSQIIKGIKTLKRLKLIYTWQMHWWLNEEHTKKSPKHITAFRILEPEQGV